MLVIGAALVGAVACSKDSASAGDPHVNRVALVSDADRPFELAATHYRPTPLTSFGTLVGMIESGALPQLDESTHECETGTKTPPQSAAALVWITGLESGKDLPVEKRADLSSEDCGLDPSIVATTVGSTVNVYNDDAALHKLVFRGRPVDNTVTMPFFNTGQVVASEKLTKRVGFVSVICERHPWTHGTIAVFDQPYFAVTDERGHFSLDSVPPGSYTLMVWRPDLGKPIERRIQITAHGTTNLNIGGGEGETSVGDQSAAGEVVNGTKRSRTIAAKSKAR